ncbi:T6SS immunity protein Tli4 family protein [Luteimonas sp. A537]
MNTSSGTPYCVGLHEVALPPGAKAKVTSTYAGLRDQDKGPARWDMVVASLRERSDAAEAKDSPRSDRTAELYRAAGANPQAAFSNSRLVGFDTSGEAAVIAEHSGPSAAFTIEAHRVQDGRHYVFEGESSQASRYPAVRDGVLETISRYSPRERDTSPPANAFCTANGYFRLKDGKDVAGDAQLVVTFPDMPGVSFSLSIYGLVEPSKEPAFAQRVARDLAELTQLGGQVKRLHEGEREYGGQTGGMVAISVPSEDPGVGDDFKYFWHAAGRPMDPYKPEIEAELLADGARGIDQDALDALWNKLMGGFQLRGGMR